MRDTLAGTRRMHERAHVYLPKWPKEDDKKYVRRSTAAKFYGGTQRTLSAAVGMLFAKPPAIDERLQSDGILADQWENIDAEGTDGAVFLKRFAEDCIADGFGGILVDFPPIPADETITQDVAERLNLRPYWSRYQRSDILSWRVGIKDNEIVPVQIVLREGKEQPLGLFGTQFIEQYRVLRLTPVILDTGATSHVASWETLEERKDRSGTVTVVSTGRGFFRGHTVGSGPASVFTRIPFAIGYGGRTDAPFTAQPPLLDVANTNIAYWRIETNLTYYEALCAFPMIHTKGRIKGPDGKPVPMEFGPSTHIETTAEGGAAWVELLGGTSTILTASLAREKRDMSELGMSFLAGDSRGVESAEAKRLDATAENATLATSAQGIEDAANMALMFHAQYLGLDPSEAPSVTINRDFESTAMDPQTMVAYVTAVEKAGLNPRLLLEAWQRGGRIAEDVDLDALEAEMVAGMEAAADAARVRAEMQAEAQANALTAGAAE